MPEPIYVAENCEPAYQLDWVYSLFWHRTPVDFAWYEELKELSEKDNIRLLQHAFEEPNISKFLISTQPHVAPITIAQRVKGRLQRLIRDKMADAFRRNYGLRSIGSTRREKLEKYLESQLAHHPMADERVMARLTKYQIVNEDVDLSQPSQTSHALYWYNVHLVFVNEARWMEIRDETLKATRDMIVKAAAAKGHWLSRGAIVPDHVHLAMRCNLTESPEEVALSYMNNLAYVGGMRPTFRYGYYVGTFSEYDLGVIPSVTAESCAPPSKLGGGEQKEGPAV
jgi:REP element-mobilizing transposase RayT